MFQFDLRGTALPVFHRTGLSQPVDELRSGCRDAALEQGPLLRYGIHLDAIDDNSWRSLPPDFQCLTQKIVRQRRHITNRQPSDLAAADPLGFSDRGIAIFEDPVGIDKERLACGR